MNFKVTKPRSIPGLDSPPHTLGLSDPRKILEYARCNYDDWRSLPGDARLAMNAVLALNHVFDWVWASWIDGHEVRAKLIGFEGHWSCQDPPNPEQDFWEWVSKKSQYASEIVRAIANGAKHAVGAPTTAGDMGLAIILNQAGWSDDPTPLSEDDLVVNYEVDGAVVQSFLREELHGLLTFWTDFMATTAKAW